MLVTIGDRRDPAELCPLPPGVQVAHWVDQAQMMPRALAMVSHGGSGSTLLALAAGVPQAFVPLFVDGPANAARVAALPPIDDAVELLQRSAAGQAIR